MKVHFLQIRGTGRGSGGTGRGLACPIYSRINDEHNKPFFIQAYARA